MTRRAYEDSRRAPGGRAWLASPGAVAVDDDGPTLAEVFAPKRKQGPKRRTSHLRTFTVSPAASVALAALTARPGGDNASAEVCAAILARAAAMGVAPR